MSAVAQNSVLSNEEYEVLIERYQRLVIDLHIPLLDHKMYHKYLVAPIHRTPAMFEKLKRLIQALTLHKERTLRILRLIPTQREQFAALRSLVLKYSRGDITTLEVQTIALNLLHSLQRANIAIIDGILEWRQGCTRPYAFIYEGESFLLTVLREYRELEGSALFTALPISFSQYPLLSNVPSLELFRGGNSQLALHSNRRSSPQPGGGGGNNGSGSSVLSSSRQIARLRRAESVLRGEPRRQIRLLKELIGLGLQGNFVPILDVVRELMPQGAQGVENGVKIQSTVLLDKLNSTLHASWESVLKIQMELHLPGDVDQGASSGSDNEEGVKSPDTSQYD